MGAAKRGNPARALAAQNQSLSLIEVIPFDQAAADAYGQIRATREQEGRPIGADESLTAATALSRQMTLVTRDAGKFSRVAGLPLDDWE
jgi:tRNA(fMet)-specific endonuclease VapC